MRTALGLIACTALVTGCASSATDAMRQNAQGNYASTSAYDSMGREDFMAAMETGLIDFDERLASLKIQAEALGPDALEEYHGCLDRLSESRRTFVAELERTRSMLADDWQDHREDLADRYVDLREELDDAYENVVEEA